MVNQFFFKSSSDHRTLGPFGFEQLRVEVASGNLTSHDLVWITGANKLLRADSIKDLFRPPAAHPAAILPPAIRPVTIQPSALVTDGSPLRPIVDTDRSPQSRTSLLIQQKKKPRRKQTRTKQFLWGITGGLGFIVIIGIVANAMTVPDDPQPNSVTRSSNKSSQNVTTADSSSPAIDKPEPKLEKHKPPTTLPPAELASLKTGLKTARQALWNGNFKRSAAELTKVKPLARFPEQLAAWQRLQQLRFYRKAFDQRLRNAISRLDAASEIKIGESTFALVVEVSKTSFTYRHAGKNYKRPIEDLEPFIAVAIIKQSYDPNEANIQAMLGAYIATLESTDEKDRSKKQAKAEQYWQTAINKGADLHDLTMILQDDYDQLELDQ